VMAAFQHDPFTPLASHQQITPDTSLM